MRLRTLIAGSVFIGALAVGARSTFAQTPTPQSQPTPPRVTGDPMTEAMRLFNEGRQRRRERLMNTAVARGATENQRRRLSDIFGQDSLLIFNEDFYRSTFMRILENPNFRIEMLDPLLAIAERISTGRNSSECLDVLFAIDEYMRTTHFRPEVLNTEFTTRLVHLVESEPYFSKGLVEIMKNPNFRLEMLNPEFARRVGSALRRTEQRAMLTHAGETYIDRGRDTARPSIVLPLLENPSFSVDMLTDGFIRKLIRVNGQLRAQFGVRRSGELYAGSGEYLFDSLLRNPNFTPSVLTNEFVNEFMRLLRFVEISLAEADKREGRFVLDRALSELSMGELTGFSNSVISGANIRAAQNQSATMSLTPFDLNWSYGIWAIGAQAAHRLSEEMGIRYFGRYTKRTLQEVYANLDPAHNINKPVLLAVFNRDDPHGVFYIDGKEIEMFTGYYKVIVTEVGTENEFYDIVNRIGGQGGRIEAMIIAAHGNPQAMSLGVLLDSRDERRYIDISDGNELQRIAYAFANNLKIVLSSCSTGQDENAIGGVLARAFNAQVFAPVSPSAGVYYYLNGQGRLTSATSRFSESREFQGGAIQQ